MPATVDEKTRLVRALVAEEIAADSIEDVRWQDGSVITDTEFCEVFALAIYEIRTRRRARPAAQRKAMRLLRRYLTAEQTRQLQQGRCFTMAGRSGRVYRLYPQVGSTFGVERHGSRWYDKRRYCLHDMPGRNSLPPADVCLAHLLLLSCDEAAFLRDANCWELNSSLWDGAWLRQLNEARRQRHNAEV